MDYEWRIVAALIVCYATLLWMAITFLRIFNSWMKRRRGYDAEKPATTPNATSTEATHTLTQISSSEESVTSRKDRVGKKDGQVEAATADDE